MGRNLGPLNIKDSYEGLVQISGSQLTDGSGSLIPSLDISASFATSASFALTASALVGGVSLQSVLDTGNTATGVDIILTGSYQRASGSFSGTVIDNITDTYTGTEKIQHVVTLTQAEYNALTPSADTFYVITDADPSMITGSVTDATLTFTKDDGSTFPLTVNNVANATSATLALSASHAVNADNAVTAQTASFLPADTNLNINSITASNASFTSASIGYLQTVTGSATIIGDAFIILNNDTPTQRFAGLKVYDSGSANVTASLAWDGLTHDWKYEYSSSAEHEGGVLLTGPEGADLATLPYPANNAIQKGTGTHHLASSSMTDDGTLVTINANVSASGYVSASTFIGDGSQLSGISTTPFPYTGSAEITGSLEIIGTITSGNSNNAINVVAGDENQAIVGGENNKITKTTINTFGDNQVIIGGYGNDITGNFTNESAIIAGRDALVNAQYSTIIGGNLGTISGGFGNGMFASRASNIGAGWGTIIGGEANGITSSQQYNVVIGGSSNSITGAGFRGVVVGGTSNNVNAGRDGGVFAGNNGTVSHARSATIAGNNLSTTKEDEVVVPHLTISGSVSPYSGNLINVSSSLGTGTLIDNIGQEAIVTGSQVQHIVNLSQVEYDALTPDANTLYVIDGTETLGDTNVDGKLTGTVNTISDAAGTTALDCSVGNYFTLAMPAGGTTVLTPSNITAGQTINIEITQNATAATLTYDNTIEFPGGTPFTISTGVGAVDVLTLVSFDGVNLKATGLANFS